METVCASLRMCRISHELKFACDNTKACKQFILQNFSPATFMDDARAPMDSLPANLDLYVAGSPCQGYSKANPTAKGIKDKRSKLVFTAARFAELKKPKAILLEQVTAFRQRPHLRVFET